MPTVPPGAFADPASCLERTACGAIAFRLVGSEIILKPIYDLHFSHYHTYFRMLSEEEERAFAEAAAKEAGLSSRATDSVKIGDEGSEKAHGLAGVKTASGAGLYGKYGDYRWRHALPGGSFSYRLAVGGKPGGRTLVAEYYKREFGNRAFDVQVDGVTIHTEKLKDYGRHGFRFVEMPVPEELLKGKKTVEVKLAAKPGNMAGGLFGLWLVP